MSLRIEFVLVVATASIDCAPPKPSVTVPAPVVVVTDVERVATRDALVPPQPTLRLPRNFVPTSYAAHLAIDPSKPTFDGAIAIDGMISERSSVIWLHGQHLTIAKAIAKRPGVEAPLVVTPKGQDLLEIRAQEPLDPGAWTLAFEYRGELDPLNTAGAFRQTVAERPYVFTQLESIYARRVFPCVDEPDNKVPWQLTLDVPSQLVAVSNTSTTSEAKLDDRQKRVEFATTKPLPAYLVAFAVGPFEILDAGKTRNGTPLRVLTLAKRAAEGAWAVKTTPKILEALEDWFGMPYPFEKLDQVSIPITVGFGAMENAGLITYTETLILVDPAKASKERQHRWVEVAAHEMAHQWFGNLVTMAYWDDIWLNEGFASWISSKVTSSVDATYRDDQSELDTRNNALEADSLVSARQIRQPIETPDDILTAFDRITYRKGASVLNMFENYLGPKVFQAGVRDYLATRARGNATSKDFAAAIAKASGNPQIEAAFGSFLEQAGTPEITAAVACKPGGATLAVAQKRYLAPGSPPPPATKPWIVPICVAFDHAGTRGETCGLLTAETASIALPGTSCPRWVMPNANGRGYYRNAYTSAQVSALRDEAWPKLTWTERRALYFDVVAAVGAGALPLQLALSFVPKLLAGNDRFTIDPALELVTGVDDLVPDALRAKYEFWLRGTFGRGAATAGFKPRPGDSLDVEATRSGLIAAVGWTAREPTLIAEAIKLADGWRDLPQATRGLVLAIAVDAKPEIFERILRDVTTEPDRSRRAEMFEALAGTRDVRRQLAALGLVLDPKLDPRETIEMIALHATPANLAVAQQFFRDNHAAIMKRIPQDETASPIADMARLFTATCKADQRDAIADYVTKTFGHLPGGGRLVKQHIEKMDQCIARRALLEPEIRAWLGGVRIPKPKKH